MSVATLALDSEPLLRSPWKVFGTRSSSSLPRIIGSIDGCGGCAILQNGSFLAGSDKQFVAVSRRGRRSRRGRHDAMVERQLGKSVARGRVLLGL